MNDMAKHRDSTAPLRRARAAAWTVFLSMAGTTIAFQVYHAVEFGQMPKLLAVVYGFILLLMSVCILEIIAVWLGSKWWVKAAALAVIGGAMFMSAGATGEVVVHAAPPHMSLLFGFLMDAAALIAIHFILNGPTATAAAAAAAAREAELRAANDAAQTELRAEIAGLGERLAAAEAARISAERTAAEATARADTATRNLEAERTAKGPRKTPAKTSRTTARTSVPRDVGARADALRIIDEEPGITGKELGERLGKSERWGQLRKQEYGSHVAAPDAQPNEA